MKHYSYLLSTLLLGVALSSCGETAMDRPDEGTGGSTVPEQRELLLTLQNKLSLASVGTRADIATMDEKRIDALDIYVFGSTEIDGEYTFQEKFSYRVDGSPVSGAGTVDVQNGDGAAAVNPTVLLRPKKGLYIKLYCVANHPKLYTLNAVTPAYEEYTAFTPLVQTNPGDPANNQIKIPGIPTEETFKGLMTTVIDPADVTSVIEPALAMVGANTAAIDLHDFSLASRLYAGIKLTRSVARFDVVNQVETSRFTLTGVGMGNGRSTTTLFPLEAQGDADGNLITYPFRDVTGLTDVNNGVQTPVFYSYANDQADAGYLILKGTYQMNQTDAPVEVNYNVNFSQIKDGTGSYIEINPNHRYTVAITKADPYHIDFTLTVADWEEGSDLGSYVPGNDVATDAITVTGDGVYTAPTKTISLEKTVGKKFTLTTYSNAEVDAKVIYSAAGNAWLTVGAVQESDSDDDLWSKKITLEVTVNAGPFTAYPDATLRLTNKAHGTTTDLKVEGTDAP